MKFDAPEKIWDVIVIGGGPSGMMAAGRAAECGASVLLLEKNSSLGKKLLITGGGRCNLTNAEFDTKALLAKYKTAGKFLASPFSRFESQSAIDFFESRGVPVAIEAEKRAFPASNTARSVYDALISYMKKGGVEIVTNAPAGGFSVEGEAVTAVRTKGRLIRGRSFVIATGGISRPETGSTGDGFKWLRSLGHTVDESKAALVPVAVKDTWVKRLAGVALKLAKITIYQDGVKQGSRLGKLLFTHVGLSGPVILNSSSEIGALLRYGDVTLELDALPDLGYEKVNTLLQSIFKTNANKMLKNSFGATIPAALVPVVLDLAKIAPETFCHSVTRDERVRLMKQLKHLHMHADHLLGLDKAVVTSGGIALEEVDFKTMCSRKYSNLYVVGDTLDIDRPSGGYSLQLCWTTGFVAGSAAAAQ